MDRLEFEADYLIETPFPLARAAEMLAGEQSSGTFTRLAGETAALRQRFRARVTAVTELGDAAVPALPNAFLDRRGIGGPYHRGRITVAYPVDNVGANLPTLAATAAGNVYDLGELTAVRLLALRLPDAYIARFDAPRHAVPGTRRLVDVPEGPIIGTIIKPNIGLSPADSAELVGRLCAAGVSFIKDDEVNANPPHAPLAARVAAIMPVIAAHAERTGRRVMYAFNITDETDAMRRHADVVAQAGGSCVMASVNWIGFAGLQTLRRHTGLALHAHRNGWAMLTRHPGLGMEFAAYQVFCRLAGADHLHVNGLGGKFWESDAGVTAAARDCLRPLGGFAPVLPVVSSGQWAGSVPATHAALGGADLIFLAGGGIIGHPDGPEAGVASIRAAWEAASAGIPLAERARDCPPLARALAHFGGG